MFVCAELSAAFNLCLTKRLEIHGAAGLWALIQGIKVRKKQMQLRISGDALCCKERNFQVIKKKILLIDYILNSTKLQK